LNIATLYINPFWGDRL